MSSERIGPPLPECRMPCKRTIWTACGAWSTSSKAAAVDTATPCSAKMRANLNSRMDGGLSAHRPFCVDNSGHSTAKRLITHPADWKVTLPRHLVDIVLSRGPVQAKFAHAHEIDCLVLGQLRALCLARARAAAILNSPKHHERGSHFSELALGRG